MRPNYRPYEGLMGKHAHTTHEALVPARTLSRHSNLQRHQSHEDRALTLSAHSVVLALLCNCCD